MQLIPSGAQVQYQWAELSCSIPVLPALCILRLQNSIPGGVGLGTALPASSILLPSCDCLGFGTALRGQEAPYLPLFLSKKTPCSGVLSAGTSKIKGWLLYWGSIGVWGGIEEIWIGALGTFLLAPPRPAVGCLQSIGLNLQATVQPVDHRLQGAFLPPNVAKTLSEVHFAEGVPRLPFGVGNCASPGEQSPPPFSKQPQFAWLREQLAGMGTGTEPESVLWSCQLRAAHDGKACELPQGTAACGEWVFLCLLLVASLSQSCPLGASPPLTPFCSINLNPLPAPGGWPGPAFRS